MALIKQNTNYNRLFLMISSGDHISGLTGGVATTTITISKAGAAFGAPGAAVSELSQGWYKAALTSGDTNTLGDLAFHVIMSGCDPTDFVDQVVAFDFIGTDAKLLNLSANTIVSGQAITGTLSTTAMTTNLTSTSNSQYVNRIVIWTGGVLQNQASIIVSYDGSTKTLGYSTVTQAPANGDFFIII